MGDNYEDLVELGFEGIDRFAHKFHDTVYDHAPAWPKFGRQHPPKPPAPKPARKRADSAYNGNRDASVSDEEDARNMYVEERKRDREFVEDGDGDEAYTSKTVDRGYYNSPANVGRNVVVRGRDPYGYAGGYEVAPRASDPELIYAQRTVDRPWGDEGRYRGRGRPDAFRRPSSYSPLRRPMTPPPEKRVRSRSPNHHRVAATLIGAVAGGLIGNSVKKGDNTIATIGGAIAGGIAGRNIEKHWDRHEERVAEREDERARRRWEREHGYYYN